MKLPKLIALAGLKGAGKTVVAKYLEEQKGYLRLPFAEPIKEMLKLIGFSDDELYGSRKECPTKFFGVSGREAMQSLGTEWGRHFIGEDMWVRVWDREYTKLDKIKKFWVVVEDLRFDNEAAIIRDNGGVIIKIVKNTGNIDAHESERNHIDADYLICNNGTYEELIVKLEIILNEIDSSSNPESV